MTYITDIFGTTPRTTHDYVGWLKEKDQLQFIVDYANAVTKSKPIKNFKTNFSDLNFKEASFFNGAIVELHRKAHTHLSQPNILSDFVRPKEPKEKDYNKQPFGFDRLKFFRDHQAWKDHQPLYTGEWEAERLTHKMIRVSEKILNVSVYFENNPGKLIMLGLPNCTYDSSYCLDRLSTHDDFIRECGHLGFEYNHKFLIQ